MAINKAMRAALSVLSYSEADIKKSYQVERRLKEISARRLRKPWLYHIWEHKVINGDHEVPVRIFMPSAHEQQGIFIFFHGGGWVTGSIDSYDAVCADMANQTGRVVVSVDYRLAPEHPFPAGLEDCYAVTREIFLDESLMETEAKEITLIGDSAGGNLAAAVSLMARDRGEFLPSRQILIYPATGNDHSEFSPFPSVRENGTDYLLTTKRVQDYMELYRASDEDLMNPYYAPLAATDFTNQPDTLIITAEYCPLRDEGEAYGKALEAAGNKVKIFRMPNALHGYFSLPVRFSQVKKTYALINRFLTEGETHSVEFSPIFMKCGLYPEKLFGQIRQYLSRRLNCSMADFEKDGVIFSVNDRESEPFLEICTMGKSVIVSASEKLLPKAEKLLKGKSRDEIFECPLVYGQSIYYVPDFKQFKRQSFNRDYQYILLQGEEIGALKGVKDFENALVFDENGETPTRMVLYAKKNNEIVGLAGASDEAEGLWELGVDVKPEHRESALATILVSNLAAALLEKGIIPFYCASVTNIGSQAVAHRSGFISCWVSTYRTILDGSSVYRDTLLDDLINKMG